MKLKIKNYYILTLFLILLLAAFLRFYRLGERYGIFSDMARDIIVGRESLKHWQFPVVGSFSSAGPFVFGPLFYWYLSFCYLPSPNTLILPWLGIALLSVLFVYLNYKIGEKLENPTLGLFLALLAATAYAQVLRSDGLTQHSFVSLSTCLTLYFFILYYKTKKSINVFYLGLATGLGIAMHYQALNLLFFGFAIFFHLKKKLFIFLKNLFFYLGGLIIPNLPIMIWDSGQEWANTRNMLDYFLIGQYRIYVPNRWLTYLTDYWPKLWSSVSGGYPALFWLTAGLILFFLVKNILKQKLKTVYYYLLLIFLIQLVLFRYHRGERFEGYTLYFHPLILLFSGWAAWQIYLFKKSAGMVFLLMLALANLTLIIPHLRQAQNQIPIFREITQTLTQKYPDKKFSLWDYNFGSAGHSYGIAVWLDSQNLIDKTHGQPVGVCNLSCPDKFEILSEAYAPVKVADLKNIDKKELETDLWHDVNPETVWEDVGFWWQKEPLTSPFSLKKYLFSQ